MFAQIKHAAIYTQNPQSAIAFYENIPHETDHQRGDGKQSRSHQRRFDRSRRIIPAAWYSRGVGPFRLRSRRCRQRPAAHKEALPPSDHYKVWKKFPSPCFAAMIQPAPSSTSPNAPTPKLGKATKKPAGIKRGSSTMSSSALTSRRRWPIFPRSLRTLRGQEPPLGPSICLSDGKVRLLIQPTNDNSYMSMRQGLDHIGYQVESINRRKRTSQRWRFQRRRQRQGIWPADLRPPHQARYGRLQDRPVCDLGPRRCRAGLFRGLITLAASDGSRLRITPITVGLLAPFFVKGGGEHFQERVLQQPGFAQRLHDGIATAGFTIERQFAT